MANILSGIFFLVIGIMAIVLASAFPSSASYELMPGFYPAILAVILIGMSLALLVTGIINVKKTQPSFTIAAETKKGLAVLGILLAYVVIVNVLGYMVSTFAMLAGMSFFLGGSKKQSLILAVLMLAFLCLVFKVGFNVSLPTGLLI